LLKHEVFGTSDTSTWCRFANAFQKRYLLATKQDRQRQKRPLSLQDLLYIYSIKFSPIPPNELTAITIASFDNFWNWFGPVLYRIRYQRHLLVLWLNGLICGFVSKQESEKILRGASRGAFMIRFSEQRPGELAIAYIPLEDGGDLRNTPHQKMLNASASSSSSGSVGGSRVHHYLLQSDDIYAAKKTLPDFLGKCFNLSHIIQVTTNPQKGRVYQQISKDHVLSEYYSKTGRQENTLGYEKQLI